MASLLEQYLDPFLFFLLVLTRVSGLMLSAPLLSSRAVPLKIRAFLALGLSAMVLPLAGEIAPPRPDTLLDLALLLGGELMLGGVLGIGVTILLAGLQLAGQIAGQMSGAQLADAVDPNFETNIPVFSQVGDWVTLAVFLAIGGHRYLIGSLLDTFAWLPPGGPPPELDLLPTLTAIVQASFSLGIRAAAPAMAALLLSTLVLGLISRTLPQLNVLALGFSLNALVLLGAFAVSLGAMALMFHEQADVAVDQIREVLRAGAGQATPSPTP